jgi:hypothetical protein
LVYPICTAYGTPKAKQAQTPNQHFSMSVSKSSSTTKTMTEANILANVFEQTRQLSRFYISRLKETDPTATIQVGQIPLNSVYWIVAHLAWAEYFLLVTGTNGTQLKPEWAWLLQYGFGSDGKIAPNSPDFKTAFDTLNQIHSEVMEHLNTLSPESLDEENTLGFNFGGLNTKRSIIQHAIRHEGTHAGHLGWLCKLNGIKTV